MAVRKLGSLDSDITTLLPDNTEQLIKPEHVRGLMADLRESLAEAWGLLDCTANTVTVQVGTTPITLTGVWTGSVVDTGMGANQGAGTVQAYSAAGWNHMFQFVASVLGQTGVEVTFTLQVNGANTAVSGTVQLRGNAAPQLVHMESFRQAAPAGASYSVTVVADRAVTLSMPRGFMRIIRKPTQ